MFLPNERNLPVFKQGQRDQYENRMWHILAEKIMDNRRIDRERGKKQLKRHIESEAIKSQLFYCLKCKREFLENGVKTYAYDGKITAFYRAFHKCGRESVRRITEKADDEFYNLSEVVKMQRQQYRDDMLSPYQQRFRTLYGDINKDREKESQEDEEKIMQMFGTEGAGSYTPEVLKLYKRYERDSA